MQGNELRMGIGPKNGLIIDVRCMMDRENIIKDKSHFFALDIINKVRKFPNNNEGFIIGKQLLKSATSIGANVEETVGAFTKNDFTYKMNLALKETRETKLLVKTGQRLKND